MAVRPQELDDDFREEVKSFEEIIDRNLKNTSFWNGGNEVTVTAPNGMLDGHFKSLREIYLKAGWSEVRREFGHQRDPLNAIVFTK
jgi:hypothetical protein